MSLATRKRSASNALLTPAEGDSSNYDIGPAPTRLCQRPGGDEEEPEELAVVVSRLPPEELSRLVVQFAGQHPHMARAVRLCYREAQAMKERSELEVQSFKAYSKKVWAILNQDCISASSSSSSRRLVSPIPHCHSAPDAALEITHMLDRMADLASGAWPHPGTASRATKLAALRATRKVLKAVYLAPGKFGIQVRREFADSSLSGVGGGGGTGAGGHFVTVLRALSREEKVMLAADTAFMEKMRELKRLAVDDRRIFPGVKRVLSLLERYEAGDDSDGGDCGGDEGEGQGADEEMIWARADGEFGMDET